MIPLLRRAWPNGLRPRSTGLALVAVAVVSGLLALAIGRMTPTATLARAVRASQRTQPALPPTTTPAPPTSTTLATPPTTADPAATTLAAQLSSAMEGNAACFLVRRGGTDLVASAAAALAPASTQKLVVGAAALAALGPDYRFVTRVVSDAAPVNGRAGHLWIVGSGDPMLATDAYLGLVLTHSHYPNPPVTPLDWLAASIRHAGVVASKGISGDDSLLSTYRWLGTWPAQYLAEGDVGSLSALSLDEGWSSWLTRWVPVSDPPAYAAGALSRLLVGAGVATGPVEADSSPPKAAVTIAQVTSAPLADIVAYMLATSDNHIAELLTRLVGKVQTGVGSTPAGTSSVLRTVSRLGVPTAGAVMVDGSGLSPEDRARCPELLAAYQLSGRFPALRSGLPVAGRTGTLYDLWTAPPLAGHVVAKGGWIDGVAGLVGTVEIGRGVDFAFLVNGTFGYPAAVRMETAALNALAAYATARP